MELELERVKLTSSVKTMSPSAAEQTFMAKLEERDREIIKLRQEVAQITDKINMVIDTKDAQIRVSPLISDTQPSLCTNSSDFTPLVARTAQSPAPPMTRKHETSPFPPKPKAAAS